MKQVDVVKCDPTYIRKSGGTIYTEDVPPTQVYWEAGYHDNWKKFIKAAILKYQDDPRIAYMRFGTGVSGESDQVVGASNEPSCVTAWNSYGMSYSRWLANALSIVDYIASLNPHIPITVGVNDIGVWDKGDLGFATALAWMRRRNSVSS